MKNASKIFFALAFVVTALIAVGSFVAGYEETSERFSVTAVIAVAGFGVASAAKSGVFGFQWTRTEETLLNHLASADKGGTQVFDNFTKGRLRFQDRVIYRALLIDGFSGNQKIWDNTANRLVGITNVHQAKLDKDEILCIDTVLIEAINSGGAGTDPAAQAAYDSVTTAWGAGIANGQLTLKQDNNPLIVDLPGYVCGSAADSMFAKGAADGYKLKNPVILEGDKAFEVWFEFATAVAASNTDFMKVSLFGVSTRKRGLV
jgi:hypothetical protein